MFEQTEQQRQNAFRDAGVVPSPAFATQGLTIPGTNLVADPSGQVSPSTTTSSPLSAPSYVSADMFRQNQGNLTGDAITKFLEGFTQQQQQLQALSAPTQEESDLTSKLLNLEQTELKELNRSENRLAPMLAITGEQAAIRRSANIEKQGLASSLSALTAQRTSKLNALEKSIGLNKDILNFTFKVAELQKPDTQVITNTDAEGNVVATVLDKSTGQVVNQMPLGNVGKPTQESVNHQILTETDANGNVTIATVDRATGEIINTQKLPGAGKGVSNAGNIFTKQEVIKGETDLRKEFNQLPVVKDFNSVKSSYQQVQTAYSEAIQKGTDKNSKAAADQVLVVAFNKMIDPASVVREGEFARSTAGQSIINRLKGAAEKVVTGGVGLTDTDRKAIVDVVGKLYTDYGKLYNEKVQEYRGYASEFGGSPDKIGKPSDIPTNAGSPLVLKAGATGTTSGGVKFKVVK